MMCLRRLVVTLLVGVTVVSAIGENAINFETITGILSGLGTMAEKGVQTINVPTKAIMGRWFQMYKAALNFDVFKTQMFCPVSYFKPNAVMGSGGFSMEEAYRVVSKSGPIETFKRDVNKVGPGQYWTYTEEYFYPRQFYIVAAGPKFDNETAEADDTKIEWFVATDGNRLQLMVYARDPLQFFQNYNEPASKWMSDNGFGGSVFWNTPRPIYQGPDCEWPSEKEVFARRVLKNHEAAERAKNGTQVVNQSPIAALLEQPQQVLQNWMRGQ